MSQSLFKNLLHLIFSTKHRTPSIPAAVRPKLFAYQAGIFQKWDSPVLVIGGAEDHIHALFSLSKNHPLIKIVEQVKASSSKWMKEETGNSDFYWQNGYAAFSVSQSNVESVKRYIENQEEHHHRLTFQEELRIFFKRHDVDFDERYVWE